jgi:hypothetical protein
MRLGERFEDADGVLGASYVRIACPEAQKGVFGGIEAKWSLYRRF